VVAVSFNGHEGNTIPICVAAQAVQAETDTDVLLTSPHVFVYSRPDGKQWEGHAGKWEVATVLAYNPRLFHPEKATNPSPFEVGFEAHHKVRGSDGWIYYRDFREIAGTGWYGYTIQCTQNEANEIVNYVADKIVEKINTLFPKRGP
jgi:creatinine amidohydrolase/Fe(II)-dependent formamide hydrolase-like protein